MSESHINANRRKKNKIKIIIGTDKLNVIKFMGKNRNFVNKVDKETTISDMDEIFYDFLSTN